MSKTSCITHTKRQQLVIIREDYLAICANDHCAAALLNVLEYWTNSKMDNQEQSEIDNAIAISEQLEPTQNTDLWIYKRIPDFQEELLGLFGERKISTALDLLESAGFISVRNNPRYKWDKTKQYLFNINMIETALQNKPIRNRKNEASQPQKGSVNTHQKAAAIPKNTTQITTKSNASQSAADYPKSLKRWKPEHSQRYFAENFVILSDLVSAWGYDLKLYDLIPHSERMEFIETHQGLMAARFDVENYGSLAAHARVKAWQKNPRVVVMLEWITDWRNTRLQSPAQDEPKMAHEMSAYELQIAQHNGADYEWQ